MDSSKQTLLSEFESMRSFESEASEFYREAAQDPLVTDPTMQKRLNEIADDEQRHVEMVGRIMNIIQNCMKAST